MKSVAILVTDKIYAKTRRHLEKVRQCSGVESVLYLACASGFDLGLDAAFIRDLVKDILVGSIEELACQIRLLAERNEVIAVIAMNQSAILPALAVQRTLGLPIRSGFIESCDKSETRRRLQLSGDDLAMPYCEALPGVRGSADHYFSSAKYVVKPAFGMSSAGVKICSSWQEASSHAESACHSKEWVPNHVMQALYPRAQRTDKRIIEPYIDGTEFSVDGWINGHDWYARVQHKLYMVQGTFIGDGPTVSPPIDYSDLPKGWCGLKNAEDEICRFGLRVLDAIGFTRGVFHIEGRETFDSSELKLIEVNPRAPGGSLWRSALLRTGYDLETVDASLQLGLGIPKPNSLTYKHVLHYPFYAKGTGVLSDWGELEHLERTRAVDFTVDFAAQIGDFFDEDSISEEPYLAFAVTHANTVEGIVNKCHEILNIRPPVVVAME